MPVIRDIPISLKTKEVIHRAGFRGQSYIRPEIKSLIVELLVEVKKEHLLEPAVAYEIYSLADISCKQGLLETKGGIHEPLFLSSLSKAEEFLAVVCTIGPRLEKQATNFFKQNEPLRGFLLDGIGSAAVDLLADKVYKLITETVCSRGYRAGSPISPGMQGVPITEQQWLFHLVPVEEIGVSLTPSGVMFPLKTTSMVIGIGPNMKTGTRAAACAQCELRATCPYRKDIKGRNRKRTR